MIQTSIHVPLDGEDGRYLVLRTDGDVVDCTFEGRRGKGFGVQLLDLEAAMVELQGRPTEE